MRRLPGYATPEKGAVQHKSRSCGEDMKFQENQSQNIPVRYQAQWKFSYVCVGTEGEREINNRCSFLGEPAKIKR